MILESFNLLQAGGRAAHEDFRLRLERHGAAARTPAQVLLRHRTESPRRNHVLLECGAHTFLGAVALHSKEGKALLAFPAIQVGKVQVIDISSKPSESTVSMIIAAHKHEVVIIQFNPAGTMLATASTSGTIARVFDIQDATMAKPVGEYRRSGFASATILALAFNAQSNMLAVVSSTGTLHVFDVEANGATAVVKKSFPIPACSSAICMIQPLSHRAAGTGDIGAGVSTPGVMVACSDGTFSVLAVRERVGESDLHSFYRFYQPSTSILDQLYEPE